MAMSFLILRRISIALAVVASILAGHAKSAKAQSRFDGAWSVLIITDAGDCDRAYRYGLQIVRGRIFYEGGGVDLRGRVSSNGRATVTIQQGNRYAVGTGRLSRDRGNGTWRGTSPSGRCSGRWQAERR
jgi:hypothetical protein